MPTNRHAQIRYTVLDKCFSNFNKEYNYQDLLNEVNGVLYELGTEGIQLRQLQYDIAHMKSDAGYGIELDEDLKIGKKRIFRYLDKGFSLANNPLNVEDAEQLETTLAILTRYKSREEFNWLEELIPRMELAFDLVSSGDNSAISYQENPDLKGRELVGVLFNVIIKKSAIEVVYKAYNKDKEVVNVHPYHLKQHNNRWFLFCYNENYQALSNYPLDRIESVKEVDIDYKESSINWLDYFDEIIGVTKPLDANAEMVHLKFSEGRINYVLTKPLHGTQKIDRADPTGLTVKIEVIPNPELYQLILSFGEDVKIISPSEVQSVIKEKINSMYNNYNHAN